MIDLIGKKIVVCGGAGRMGNSICSYLKNIGAIPIVVDAILGDDDRHLSFKCDLSDADDTERVFNKIFNDNSRVDYLVNALRIRSEEKVFSSIKLSSLLIQKEINAYLFPMHFFCMKKRISGSLVNISSILGKSISLDVPLEYHVAKAAIEQASRYYASNFQKFKVRVNCISPGLISNGPSENCSTSHGASYYSQLACKLPIQRSGGHNDVASLTAYLLSDASGFVIGENIKIDGGGHLMEPLSI